MKGNAGLRCRLKIRLHSPTLIRLADHSDMRRRMGKNSRKLAEKAFSRDLLADQLVSFLEKVHEGEVVDLAYPDQFPDCHQPTN